MTARTISGRAGVILCALFLLCSGGLCTGVLAQGAPTRDSIRDDVFVTMQRATSSVAGAALQQAALRQQAGNAALAGLLRQRSDLTDLADAEQGALAAAVGARGAAAEAEVERVRVSLARIRAPHWTRRSRRGFRRSAN